LFGNAKYCALQLDKSTDVPNEVILLVCLRFQKDDGLKEEFLFSAFLTTKTTSSEMFETVRDYVVDKCGLDLKFCVGLRVCSDGAAAKDRRTG
jgi:hypothetical protein